MIRELFIGIQGIVFLFIIISYYIVPPTLRLFSCNLKFLHWLLYIFGMMFLVFMSPSYVNLVMIYSIANLNDVSWGNRDTNSAKRITNNQNSQLLAFRTNYFTWFGVITFGLTYTYIMIF